MAWPVVGVVGGGEASAVAQPTTGGRSRWHDRRCFAPLEQEGQRLKKHYDHWMDIVRSLELELFILTKLTKPSVLVNLVGPQVSHPLWWVPASRGYSFFWCVIRRHFLACEDIAGGSDMSTGGMFFREIQRPFRWVPAIRWRNHYFARTVHGRWMSFVDHVDQAAPRAPRRWTTARPRKGTTWRQGRLGSCFPRGGESDCTRVYWFVCRRRRITTGVGE